MIEPTNEMDLALLREADGGPRAAVEAVLAIVERDYPLIIPCPTGERGRCVAVQHSAANAGICREHGCVYPRPSPVTRPADIGEQPLDQPLPRDKPDGRLP